MENEGWGSHPDLSGPVRQPTLLVLDTNVAQHGAAAAAVRPRRKWFSNAFPKSTEEEPVSQAPKSDEGGAGSSHQQAQTEPVPAEAAPPASLAQPAPAPLRPRRRWGQPAMRVPVTDVPPEETQAPAAAASTEAVPVQRAAQASALTPARLSPAPLPTRLTPGPMRTPVSCKRTPLNDDQVAALTPPECKAMLDAVILAIKEVDNTEAPLAQASDEGFEAWLARAGGQSGVELGPIARQHLQDLYQRASEATVLRSLLELTKANELDMAEREAEDTLRHMDMLAEENAELLASRAQLMDELAATKMQLEHLLSAHPAPDTTTPATGPTATSDTQELTTTTTSLPGSPAQESESPLLVFPAANMQWVNTRHGPQAPSPSLSQALRSDPTQDFNTAQDFNTTQEFATQAAVFSPAVSPSPLWAALQHTFTPGSQNAVLGAPLVAGTPPSLQEAELWADSRREPDPTPFRGITPSLEVAWEWAAGSAKGSSVAGSGAHSVDTSPATGSPDGVASDNTVTTVTTPPGAVYVGSPLPLVTEAGEAEVTGLPGGTAASAGTEQLASPAPAGMHVPAPQGTDAAAQAPTPAASAASALALVPTQSPAPRPMPSRNPSSPGLSPAMTGIMYAAGTPQTGRTGLSTPASHFQQYSNRATPSTTTHIGFAVWEEEGGQEVTQPTPIGGVSVGSSVQYAPFPALSPLAFGSPTAAAGSAGASVLSAGPDVSQNHTPKAAEQHTPEAAEQHTPAGESQSVASRASLLAAILCSPCDSPLQSTGHTGEGAGSSGFQAHGADPSTPLPFAAWQGEATAVSPVPVSVAPDTQGQQTTTADCGLAVDAAVSPVVAQSAVHGAHSPSPLPHAVESTAVPLEREVTPETTTPLFPLTQDTGAQHSHPPTSHSSVFWTPAGSVVPSTAGRGVASQRTTAMQSVGSAAFYTVRGPQTMPSAHTGLLVPPTGVTALGESVPGSGGPVPVVARRAALVTPAVLFGARDGTGAQQDLPLTPVPALTVARVCESTPLTVSKQPESEQVTDALPVVSEHAEQHSPAFAFCTVTRDSAQYGSPASPVQSLCAVSPQATLAKASQAVQATPAAASPVVLSPVVQATPAAASPVAQATPAAAGPAMQATPAATSPAVQPTPAAASPAAQATPVAALLAAPATPVAASPAAQATPVAALLAAPATPVAASPAAQATPAAASPAMQAATVVASPAVQATPAAAFPAVQATPAVASPAAQATPAVASPAALVAATAATPSAHASPAAPLPAVHATVAMTPLSHTPSSVVSVESLQAVSHEAVSPLASAATRDIASAAAHASTPSAPFNFSPLWDTQLTPRAAAAPTPAHAEGPTDIATPVSPLEWLRYEAVWPPHLASERVNEDSRQFGHFLMHLASHGECLTGTMSASAPASPRGVSAAASPVATLASALRTALLLRDDTCIQHTQQGAAEPVEGLTAAGALPQTPGHAGAGLQTPVRSPAPSGLFSGLATPMTGDGKGLFDDLRTPSGPVHREAAALPISPVRPYSEGDTLGAPIDTSDVSVQGMIDSCAVDMGTPGVEGTVARSTAHVHVTTGTAAVNVAWGAASTHMLAGWSGTQPQQPSPVRVSQQPSPVRVSQQPSPARVSQQPSPARVSQQPSPARAAQQPSPARPAQRSPLRAGAAPRAAHPHTPQRSPALGGVAASPSVTPMRGAVLAHIRAAERRIMAVQELLQHPRRPVVQPAPSPDPHAGLMAPPQGREQLHTHRAQPPGPVAVGVQADAATQRTASQPYRSWRDIDILGPQLQMVTAAAQQAVLDVMTARGPLLGLQPTTEPLLHPWSASVGYHRSSAEEEARRVAAALRVRLSPYLRPSRKL